MRQMNRISVRAGGSARRHSAPLVVLVALLLAVTGVGTASAASLVSDDFEDGNAAGWVTTGGTWIVVREESRVLRQSSLAAGALARTGQPGWRDYTIAAEVRPDSFNGMPGFAGVVVRAQSTTTFYALVLRPNDTVALTRTVGGRSTTLATKSVTVTEDRSYTLVLRAAGRNLTGSVDGVELTASDGFIHTGPAGLVTTWTTASFDDVSVDTDAPAL
ncbi:hypothetical protein I0C86_32170 [Plantactinospora sp. S1510]|uniref:3-keto-disaccharide hydrolase domain-containing protein n=1 Tax=Plantactinospora alkalitolerans TaxID=2789879 RepID=A0ABS0H5E8_9ACTN|nr:hypothetical protein [Plantactinospora alkalitolerans]MBF9133559.1 hypothetical protein [Plantactinospora alkalitolerans]